MRKKTLWISIPLLFLLAAGIGAFRETRELREKERLEFLVAPAVLRVAEGIAPPRPQLSFVTLTEGSLRIAVSWEQNTGLEAKNEVRSEILAEARKALRGESVALGRDLSVVFTDEISSQGVK